MKLLLLMLFSLSVMSQEPEQPIAKPFITIVITRTASDGTVEKVVEIKSTVWTINASESVVASSMNGEAVVGSTSGYRMYLDIPEILSLTTGNKPEGEKMMKGLSKESK